MKPIRVATILITFAVGTFIAMAVSAQHEGHSTRNNPAPSAVQGRQAMSRDQMMMANEPHHVLAMAYRQNLLVFTKALQEQASRSSTVHIDFARAAVTEMRRSVEQMKVHHQEHMKTMSPEMQAKMSGMMQEMEAHRIQLNTQLAALEQEVRLSAPDAKQVASLAASVQTHLDAMGKMKQEGNTNKIKM